jgi:ATP-dependent Clp protease protease subunit
MFAIYDAMTSLRSDVATYCVGQAASAAAFLLASGSPGMRRALANSRVLLHQPHGGIHGQSADIAIHAEEIQRQRRRMEELLAEHTHQPVERVHADLERDFILDAEGARAYGVVDEVVEPRRLATVARLER